MADFFIEVIKKLKKGKFVQSKTEPVVFIDSENLMYMLVHVDDVLLFGPLDEIKATFEEIR